jgi:hypothetical protein
MKTYCGVLNAYLYWLDHSLDCNGSKTYACAINFGLRSNFWISRYLSQAGGAAKKDVGSQCFGKKEKEEEKYRTCHPENFPERPSPTA